MVLDKPLSRPYVLQAMQTTHAAPRRRPYREIDAYLGQLSDTGRIILRQMKLHRMSQRSIAARLAVSRQFIGQVMSGKRAFPLDRLDQLAETLYITDRRDKDALFLAALNDRRFRLKPELRHRRSSPKT